MTKQVVTTLRMMPVPEGVVLPYFAKQIDRDTGRFTPGEGNAQAAHLVLDELHRWSTALAPLCAVQGA